MAPSTEAPAAKVGMVLTIHQQLVVLERIESLEDANVTPRLRRALQQQGIVSIFWVRKLRGSVLHRVYVNAAGEYVS